MFYSIYSALIKAQVQRIEYKLEATKKDTDYSVHLNLIIRQQQHW